MAADIQTGADRDGTEDRSRGGRGTGLGGAADRVAAIVAAAEATAETIRAEAESQAGDRIAESDRAAQYRVSAAEKEAGEITAAARAAAERLRADSQQAAEEARTTEASEALVIADTARRKADEMLKKATEAATTSQREAERYTRELLSGARTTADEVRNEGMELGANLREMGNSLRFNSERLLRDVAQIHGQLISRIDRSQQHMATPRGGRADEHPSRTVRRRRRARRAGVHSPKLTYIRTRGEAPAAGKNMCSCPAWTQTQRDWSQSSRSSWPR